MKHKYDVDVTVNMTVEIDDEVFTPERMREFNESIYPLGDLEEHAAHVAEQLVRLGFNGSTGVSLEGYGPLEEAGVSVEGDGTSVDYVRKLV